MSDDTPVIETRENGPLIVKNVDTFILPDGTKAETKALRVLCRCGHSKSKPYCDGSHKEAGFDGGSQDVTERDKTHSYEGESVNIYYNKLLCSHAGECVKAAPSVFDPKRKPWIQPDSGGQDDIKQVVANCPSGALSFSTPDQDRDWLCSDAVEITVEPDGPLRVKNIPIECDYWADGQTTREYVLCRCGLSKNKPFCDGTHADEGWSDS